MAASPKPASRRVNDHSTEKHGRAEAKPGAFERHTIIPERMPRAPLRSPRHQAKAHRVIAHVVAQALAAVGNAGAWLRH
eukprot:6571212-Prymnesium_polylepis.1